MLRIWDSVYSLYVLSGTTELRKNAGIVIGLKPTYYEPWMVEGYHNN